MMHLLYIDKGDGRGLRQYMYELNQVKDIKEIMQEGIDKGWHMEFLPAGHAKKEE